MEGLQGQIFLVGHQVVVRCPAFAPHLLLTNGCFNAAFRSCKLKWASEAMPRNNVTLKHKTCLLIPGAASCRELKLDLEELPLLPPTVFWEQCRYQCVSEWGCFQHNMYSASRPLLWSLLARRAFQIA